jgi:phage tail sheath protein FI
MCAARGDLLAVLALPEHYRERTAIAHVHALKSSAGRPPGSEPDPIFSYGALYHPWLYASDPADPSVIRRSPPDGAAAGVIAARAARRGAWVAPANESLRDVVQLDPPLGGGWLQALQDAQVNVARHEPSGFLWLAADTLSDDAELRPIGVRRLLHLLRRAAVLHGAIYAFEPNSEAFRRTVQRGFERLLARMFELGAFSGVRASDAYRVNTGSPPNTPASIEAGRLIIDLNVAPSRPLAFLTVRLVRTGEGSLQVEAR